MRALLGIGLVDVLVEAGPRLFTALWDAGVVDELVCVHAGGVAGPSAPAVYLGASPVDASAPGPGADVLPHAMAPLECGLVGDVAASVWRPAESVPGEKTTGLGITEAVPDPASSSKHPSRSTRR